ncbi:MAG TPA: hypothetical protein VG929_05485 [Actinomycetota bacterium]|nr:hypothetical protein [Actinomycetota bacterium]
MTAEADESGRDADSASSRRSERRVGLKSAAIACGVAFLVGVVVALVVNGVLSGPSLEVVEGSFQAVTGDLDGISIDGGEGEYDLSHATGTECLNQASVGDAVSLGIANIDRGDVEIPFEGEMNNDRVVLWVTCGPPEGNDL